MSKQTILLTKSYFDSRQDLQQASHDIEDCIVIDVDSQDLQNMPPLDMDECSFVDENNGVVLPDKIRKKKS